MVINSNGILCQEQKNNKRCHDNQQLFLTRENRDAIIQQYNVDIMCQFWDTKKRVQKIRTLSGLRERMNDKIGRRA